MTTVDFLPLITDNRETVAELAPLASQFTCPVCLQILRETVVVKACLHRFCHECIQKSLHVGKRECPSCRSKCASKRDLRRDLRFDSLLNAILTDVDSFERDRDRHVRSITEEELYRNAVSKMKDGFTRQAHMQQGKRAVVQVKRKYTRAGAPRAETMDAGLVNPTISGGVRRRGKARPKNVEGHLSNLTHTTAAADPIKPKPVTNVSAKIAQQKIKDAVQRSRGGPAALVKKPVVAKVPRPQDQEIGFFMQLHPEETLVPRLIKPRLTVSTRIKIKYLCQFLAAKLQKYDASRYQISVISGNKLVSLFKEFTLEEVFFKYWSHEPGEFRLIYSIKAR